MLSGFISTPSSKRMGSGYADGQLERREGKWTSQGHKSSPFPLIRVVT